MRLYVGYTTAAFGWLMTPMDGAALATLPRVDGLYKCAESAAQQRAVDLSQFEVTGLPIHVLVPDAHMRGLPDELTYHTHAL